MCGIWIWQGYLIDLLGVAKYHFTSAWDIFAKEGVAYTHQKVIASGWTVSKTETMTKTENRFLPEVEVGIGYYIIPNAELSLTYNHVFGNELSIDEDKARSKVASVNGLMLGATLLF